MKGNRSVFGLKSDGLRGSSQVGVCPKRSSWWPRSLEYCWEHMGSLWLVTTLVLSLAS